MATDFANLPTLVLNEIFKYLNCNDRIRCKRVCRRWYDEIKSKNQNQKCLVIRLDKRMNSTFYHDNELIKIENNLIGKNVDMLFRSDFKQEFKNIKKICLFYDGSNFKQEIDSIKFEKFLRIFNQIGYLQLVGYQFNSGVTINLPQIKDLILIGACDHLISFNCPSLLKLTIENQTKIKINLKKLKKLKCLNFNDQNEFVPNVKLVELEYLVIHNDFNEIHDRLLNYYPRLKRLVWYTSKARTDLIELNEQKKRYRLKNLKILINGFEESNDFIPEFDVGDRMFLADQESIETLFNGYSKLIHPLDKAHFDYNLLFDKFKILPNDFFDKFQKIKRIKISSVKNYIHLREFLKIIPILISFELNLSELEIQFLDQLYLLSPSIHTLIVIEPNSRKALNYDLMFLMNLKIHFFHFKSNLLPVDLIRKVGKNCKFLQFFMFISETIELRIYFYPDSIHLRFNENLPLEFKNFNLLIKYLQSKHPFSQIMI